MSVMVLEKYNIFKQFVKTSENSKSPHYWECTGDLQQATNSAESALCHIVFMICMWTFRG